MDCLPRADFSLESRHFSIAAEPPALSKLGVKEGICFHRISICTWLGTEQQMLCHCAVPSLSTKVGVTGGVGTSSWQEAVEKDLSWVPLTQTHFWCVFGITDTGKNLVLSSCSFTAVIDFKSSRFLLLG